MLGTSAAFLMVLLLWTGGAYYITHLFIILFYYCADYICVVTQYDYIGPHEYTIIYESILITEKTHTTAIL